MTLTEIIFKISNLVALATWFVLIFTPNGSRLKTWVARGWISIGLSIVYIVGLSVGFEGFLNGGGFSSITEVRTLFQNDWMLLAGWVHYLAFDLLIGSKIAQDLESTNWFTKTTCLFLTFLFGPIGWFCSRLVNTNRETV